MVSFRSLLRLAVQFRKSQETRLRNTSRILSPSCYRLENLASRIRKTSKFLEVAEAKGWVEVISHLEKGQRQNLLNLRNQVSEMSEAYNAKKPVLPQLADLLAEVRQLEEEFDGLNIDWGGKFLAVKIPPVTLEEVSLGAFQIRLFWSRLAQGCEVTCFEIVALDPNSPPVQ